MPLVYKEPKWENKREENFNFTDTEENEKVKAILNLKKIIDDIPLRAEAKIKIIIKKKKKIEKAYPYMGVLEYEVFKTIIDNIEGTGKLIIFWNEKKSIFESKWAKKTQKKSKKFMRKIK
ncbi:MAG: hypothetical protein ACKKMR_02145 [Candidatus Nealsonbacteria bacterium]